VFETRTNEVRNTPKLVVHDDMNGSANVEVRKRRQVEALGDDALTAESSVSVNRQAQNLVTQFSSFFSSFSERNLESASETQCDGSDGLEMGRVGEDVDGEWFVGGGRGV
jgi:hypothetical protein